MLSVYPTKIPLVLKNVLWEYIYIDLGSGTNILLYKWYLSIDKEAIREMDKKWTVNSEENRQ